MANFDENVSLQQGSDTGQADAASIQPIGPSEVVWGGTDNRPLENLRARTELLRRYVQNVLYYLDYDRCLLVRSNAAVTLTEPAPGNYELSMVGDDLWIYPSLTPGRNSGGRVRGGRVFVAGLPYSGTPLVNDLILTASAQYTGQRGYFDADDFATVNSLTLGANRIRVDLIADPALATNVFQFAVAEAPKTKITIRYGTNGGATTLAALISAINADLTSQGTYGVANFLRATTTAAAPAGVFPTPFVGGVVQGAYDAEAHQVTAAQLAAFFAATESGIQVNRLQEGEGLAIGYPKGPVETGTPTPRGGRRQSLWDLPTDRIGGLSTNITPVVGWALFSTGREPEKIPGSIPIGKIINGEFVFIDGTRIGVGETMRLGESRVMKAALASTLFGSSGADLIGYAGSGSWNVDAALSPNPSIPAGTVEASVDAVVAHLAPTAAGTSGARRVGVESVAGSVTTGNRPLERTAASIRQALDEMLNAVPTTSKGGGVNYRVNEDGHELKGQNPINKDFTALSNGARRLGAYLRSSGDIFSARPGALDFADLQLTPFWFGGGTALNATEPVVAGSASARLRLSAGDIVARFPSIWPALPAMISYNISNPADGALIPLVFVRVQGLTSPTGDENTIYIFDRFTSDGGGTLGEFILRKLDNTNADFSAVTSYVGATVSFLSGQYTGGTNSNTKFGFHHLPGLYASMVVGAPYNDLPWLEVLTNGVPAFSPGFGQLAKKGTIFSGDRARWRVGEATERSTENILITGDKTLLDGVESGLPVDATASHHHGGSYTRVHLFSEEVQLVDRSDLHTVGIGTSLFLPTPASVDPAIAAVLVGYTVVGWICRIRIVASITNAALTTTTYTVPFRSNSTDPNPILTVEGHAQSWNATGANDSYANYFQVLRPGTPSNDVEYRVAARVNATFGRLIVYCSGYILART